MRDPSRLSAHAVVYRDTMLRNGHCRGSLKFGEPLCVTVSDEKVSNWAVRDWDVMQGSPVELGWEGERERGEEIELADSRRRPVALVGAGLATHFQSPSPM